MNPDSITVTGAVKLKNSDINRNLKESGGFNSYNSKLAENSSDGDFCLIINLNNGDNTSESGGNVHLILVQ